MLWILAVFVASLVTTLVLTPIFIHKLRASGMVGHDVHKEGRPEVPEMGGFVILFGFSAGLLAAIPFLSSGLAPLFAGFLTVLITGLIGVCDDLFGIRQSVKAWLPIFAAVPLMAIQAGVTSVIFPGFGLIELGIIYSLIVIPLEVAVLSNATNMLAGYNGLEAGLGAIASLFLAAAGYLSGNIIVTVLMLALAGACLAFLKFNRFPARVFMGDVGSFTIGAGLAAAIIIGNLETAGAIIVGAYLINGVITVIDIARRKPIEKFASLKNNVLVPPDKTYVQNLYYWLERHGNFTEKRLVKAFWALGVMFGVAGLAYLLWMRTIMVGG